MCSCSSTKSSDHCDTKDECGGSCSSTEISFLNPKTVKPISSSEDATNKYSVEVSVKARNGKGAQSSVYTGAATGATVSLMSTAAHAHLFKITLELSRSLTRADVYAASVPVEAGLAAALATVAAFNTFFAPPVTATAMEIATIAYMSNILYPFYLSLEKHISGASDSTVICVTGGSRLLQLSTNNCLFCFKLIYN